MEASDDLVRGSALVAAALRFARDSHHGPPRDGDTDVTHPIEVARILRDHGFDDGVVAAALLHDVVEDSDRDRGDIGERFGQAVCDLVDVMTEDESIASYAARKAAHRRRIEHTPGPAAAIFAADKLAKLCELSRSSSAVEPAKLEHYCESVAMLRRSHPDIPFLDQVEQELTAYRAAHPPSQPVSMGKR